MVNAKFLIQDLRFAGRLLLKDKSYCLIAAGVLALGICGVTTQLMIINSQLFDLLPFAESERLVTVALHDPSAVSGVGAYARPDSGGGVRLCDYLDIEREQHSFTDLGAIIPTDTSPMIDGFPRRLPTSAISCNFFRMLGVHPILGREFTAEDDRRGADGVVIISYRLWEDAFGRDPGILGRTIAGRYGVKTIVGVMPKGFGYPRSDDLWVPLQTVPYWFDRNGKLRPRPLTREEMGRVVGVVGRLKPDVTRGQAQAEVTVIARRLAVEHPASNANMTSVTVEPLRRAFISSRFRGTLYAMLGVVVAVLLIASFNVVNLQLARGTRRMREMAVRSALGATHGRLLLQGMTESLVIAILGMCPGVLLSWWCGKLLRGVVTSSGRGSGVAPPWVTMEIDGTVLALTIAVVAAAVLLPGMVPAWLASRTNAVDTIRKTGRGIAGGLVQRVTHGLVVAQIAITVPLLMGALLMTRSLYNQQHFDWGFDADHLITSRISTRGVRNQKAFRENLVRNLCEDPLITHAALTTRGPMLCEPPREHVFAYEVEGASNSGDLDRLTVLAENVSLGYFSTLGVGVMQGRDFKMRDTRWQSGVAIVNAAFARRHFSTGQAISRRFRYVQEADAAQGGWITIIGVVSDFAVSGPLRSEAAHAPCVFFPIGSRGGTENLTIVVRGHGDEAALAKALAAQVARLDPTLAIRHTMGVRQRLLLALRQRINLTIIFCAFSLVSVVIATAGLYGVTALSVNQRTQEFGIRMALGATPDGIMRSVLGQGARQLLVGGGIGIAINVVLGRLAYASVTDFLYEVRPFDWVVYVGVGLSWPWSRRWLAWRLSDGPPRSIRLRRCA